MCHKFAPDLTVCHAPRMDDDAALAALLDMPIDPAALAAKGATVFEIADKLGLSQTEAAMAAGPVTAAQLSRIEQVLVARAVGIGDSLPHVQAAAQLLQAYKPETYGRQAAQQGSTTLRVVVDRTFATQRAQAIEGEIVAAPLPQG